VTELLQLSRKLIVHHVNESGEFRTCLENDFVMTLADNKVGLIKIFYCSRK